MTLQPRPAYPPFDERDWRVTTSYSDRDLIRGRALAIDATADHELGRHDHHSHPWCRACWIRDDDDGRSHDELAPLANPTQTLTQLAADGHAIDARFAALQKLWAENPEPLPEDSVPAALQSLDLDLARYAAWLDYLHALDAWEHREAEARTATDQRAARYLILNGRPPTDHGPGSTPQDYADLYFDRERLRELPKVEELIAGVLPRHSYGLTIGRDGTFKSFVVLDWALSLATGRAWQGRSTEKVRVLYIAGEGAYGLDARVEAWERAWGHEVDPHMFTARSAALNLHRPGPDFDHLLDHIATGEYGLVVIDTLRRVSGAADGNTSEMGLVVDNIDRIKRATHNGTVVTVAHTGKDDRDSRGFSGIEDDADFVWHIKRDDQHIEVKNTKCKDGPDGHVFHLTATPAHGSLIIQDTGEKAAPVSTESQAIFIRALLETFPDGATSTQLLDVTGLSKSTFHRVRAELIAAGHLINSGSHRRPWYELSPETKSHQLPAPQTASDLHRSHEVPRGPTVPMGGPTGPATLGAGPRDPDDTGTPEEETA